MNSHAAAHTERGVYEGKILDGRTRYRACLELGIEPKFKTYDGDSPTAVVLSLNVKRRHLTASQKAGIAVLAEAEFAKEAKKRETAGKGADGSGGRGRKRNPVAEIPQGLSGKAREQAAKTVGASARYVQDAKAVRKASPEKFAKVLSGETTVTQAKREIQNAALRKKAKGLKLPTGKYRVIYADPPWKYGDNRSGGTPEFQEQYPVAETHYPTMSMDELKAVPVAALCEDNGCTYVSDTTTELTDPACAACCAAASWWRTCSLWTVVCHFGMTKWHKIL